MPSKEKPFKPGQEVWCVFTSYRGNREKKDDPIRYTVLKVDRRWATLKTDECRYNREVFADLESSYEEGYSVSRHKKEDHRLGRCYADIGAKLERDEICAEWGDFSREIRDMLYRNAPPGITVERITQARELLGIPKKEN